MLRCIPWYAPRATAVGRACVDAVVCTTCRAWWEIGARFIHECYMM